MLLPGIDLMQDAFGPQKILSFREVLVSMPVAIPTDSIA